MKPISIQPQLVDQVHAELVEAICNGSLPPGAPLVQERIAEELGVSRQPVVQALVLLKRQGFAEATGRRGLRVSRVGADTARRVYAVRGALDRLAAREAALRAARNGAAGSRLRAVLDAGRKAVADGSVAELIDADMAFHHAIYGLSDNPLIMESADIHWLHIRRIMGAVLREEGQRRTVWSEHEAIAGAILAGDAERAGRLAEEHVDRAAANLVGRLEQNVALSA